MLCDSSDAFSAGSAEATAVNAPIRPMTVPSRPSSVATLANVARYGVRRSMFGSTSSSCSSIAYSMSWRRRVWLKRAMPSVTIAHTADFDFAARS